MKYSFDKISQDLWNNWGRIRYSDLGKIFVQYANSYLPNKPVDILSDWSDLPDWFKVKASNYEDKDQSIPITDLMRADLFEFYSYQVRQACESIYGQISKNDYSKLKRQQLTKYNSAAFYVNTGDSEFIKETANFEIIREGRLEITDTRNGKIYRTTKELLEEGINDKALYKMTREGILQIAETPGITIILKNSTKTIQGFPRRITGFPKLSYVDKKVKELQEELTSHTINNKQ